jgi:hypothetical protein
MPVVTKARAERTLTDVPIIAPTAAYGIEQARMMLGLRKNTLPREIRLRRLRVSRRGGRYYILGSWLLAWIRAGEVTAVAPDEHAASSQPDPSGPLRVSAARRRHLEQVDRDLDATGF